MNVKLDEFGFLTLSVFEVYNTLREMSMKKYGDSYIPIKLTDIKTGFYIDSNSELTKRYYCEINGQKAELSIKSKEMVNLQRDYSSESKRYYDFLEEQMGFPKGFSTQSVIEHRGLVLSVIPDINVKDYIWLCEEIYKLISSFEKHNRVVSGFRLSRFVNTAASPMYNYIRATSTGNPYDSVITSPQTGSQFKVGLNYD